MGLVHRKCKECGNLDGFHDYDCIYRGRLNDEIFAFLSSKFEIPKGVKKLVLTLEVDKPASITVDYTPEEI